MKLVRARLRFSDQNDSFLKKNQILVSSRVFGVRLSDPLFFRVIFSQELEKTGFRVVRGRQVGEKVLLVGAMRPLFSTNL